MKVWKVLVIAAMVVGLGAAVVGAVAMARDNGGVRVGTAVRGAGMMLQNGDQVGVQQGVPRGMMRGLGNGQLSDQMVKLMQEHAKDMAAWWQKYGKDPTSAAAQAALQQLRSEHQADMQKLGLPSGSPSSGTGAAPRGPGMMGGGSTGGGTMGGGNAGGGMMGGF
jgi:hypothetical protein